MRRRLISLLLVLALLIACLPQLTLTVNADTEGFIIDQNGNLIGYNGSGGTLIIPSSVKRIGVKALSNLNNLTSVTIPGSVKIISEYAFSGCSVETLSILDGVTSIESAAFFDCSHLENVTLPKSIMSIEDSTFLGCRSLKNIIIPESVTIIGDYAFGCCSSLSSVIIPSSVTEIGIHAFEDCSKLTSITIPGSVRLIDGYAFYNCSGISEVSIPDSVTSIGNYAFHGCSGLTSVTIPDNVTYIGQYTFEDCSNLTSVTILNKNCNIIDKTTTLGDPSITTIYGYIASTAQMYAEHYGYTFVAIDGTVPDPLVSVTLSDEITHLIFADMAYARIPSNCKGLTVNQWLGEETFTGITGKAGYDTDEMLTDIFNSSNLNRLQVFQMVGDWKIVDVINGEGGYAANVFRKGNDTIIAYRGSEEGPGSMFEKDEDWRVDMKFALLNHLDSRQFGAALDTYQKYAGSGNVTLTGHSLGGALVTYVSILTGAKGYSFDGAAGHVIDLTYLFEPFAIDFHSKNQISFTNYTDPPRLDNMGAYLIQHTNADLLPGICYQTNDDFKDKSFVEFWSHNSFSNTTPGKDGKTLEFMPVAEQHSPKDNWYASADYRYLGILTGGIVGSLGGAFTGGLSGAIKFGSKGVSWGYKAGRLLKNGSVHLGTESDDDISVLNNINNKLDITAAVTENVIYGGDGSDNLIGAASGDLLIPGANNSDWLCGGLGADVYLVDAAERGNVYVSDLIGDDVIRLKNAGSLAYSSVTTTGYDQYSETYGFRLGGGPTVYLKKTMLRHGFRVLNDAGNPIAIIDTKGNCSKPTARRAAQEQADCKEVNIEGACEVNIYGPDGALAGQYDTLATGLHAEEYGVVYIFEADGAPMLTATLYADYTLEAKGTAEIDVSIVGTDEENNVDRVTVAESVELSKGDAAVEPEKHLVTQGSNNVTTADEKTSVSVKLDAVEKTLAPGETAKLTATAVNEDGVSSGDISWISTDPDVVACEKQYDGSCVITAVGLGEAEIYATSDDSGIFAICKISVATRHIDKTALNNAIKEAETRKEDDYTAESFAKVAKALEAARNVSADADQATVDAAADTLNAAIAGLEKKPSGKPEDNPFHFDDVRDESKFYYHPVYWAYEAKPQITNGIDKKHFGPDRGCTRGQVVTFLWRAAGCPEPSRTRTAFADVSPDAFYAKAVAWAVENGITNGMSTTSFAPGNTCTRGQIVTFLWRFRGGPEPTGTDTGFSDVNETAFYAKAVAWAVEAKVTNGMTATTFAPNATCTRGQIVTFLYRAMGA